MSPGGDHFDEMPAPAPLDDTAVEAFLSGRYDSAGEPGLLAAFAEDVRMAVDRPAPLPTADLARLLTDGIPTPTGATWAPARRAAAQDAHVSKRRKPVLLTELLAGLVAKLSALGMAAKAALGMAVAAAGVTGAGAANVLPDPAQHAVASAVSAATPFEFADPRGAVTGDDEVGDTGEDGADGAGKPADNHGACVSEIAKNAPRGPGGEHGQAVSTAARSDCGKSSTTTPSSSTTSTSTPSTTTTTIDDEENAIDANRGPGSRGQGNGNGNPGPGNSGPGNSGPGSSGPGNSGNGSSGPGNPGQGSSRSGR